jgi:hypothetical protein
MLEMDILKGEFDANRRVLHLSAERPAHIQNTYQLNSVCKEVSRILEEHTAEGRYYLLVDMSTIVIEPALVDEYSKKIKNISERFLVPDGLLRYGHQITRITAKLAHEQQNLDDPLFFRSKAEALNYIDSRAKTAVTK